MKEGAVEAVEFLGGGRSMVFCQFSIVCTFLQALNVVRQFLLLFIQRVFLLALPSSAFLIPHLVIRAQFRKEKVFFHHKAQS